MNNLMAELVERRVFDRNCPERQVAEISSEEKPLEDSAIQKAVASGKVTSHERFRQEQVQRKSDTDISTLYNDDWISEYALDNRDEFRRVISANKSCMRKSFNLEAQLEWGIQHLPREGDDRFLRKFRAAPAAEGQGANMPLHATTVGQAARDMALHIQVTFHVDILTATEDNLIAIAAQQLSEVTDYDSACLCILGKEPVYGFKAHDADVRRFFEIVFESNSNGLAHGKVISLGENIRSREAISYSRVK